MLSQEQEFEQVYLTFQPKIYRYLSRLIGLKEAEDLTQEVFFRIGKALTTFQNQSQLSTWIYQIATNAAIDRMRSRSFKQEAAEMYGLEEAYSGGKNACQGRRSVEEQVIRKEMNECIGQYVAVLPENYRTVVILSEMEGLKNSEIAVVLGLSVGAVKIRLHRAKAKMKELLTANCNFYRTECCGSLACEPKEPTAKKIKPVAKKKDSD
jgi:RNA polymerase sigma-70 factor (ECF subfamily)